MEMANAVYQVVDRYTAYPDEETGSGGPEMPEWLMAIQMGMMGLM